MNFIDTTDIGYGEIMAKKMVLMDPRLLRPPPPVSGLNVLYHLDGDTESIMQNQSFQESQKEDGEKASYF